MRNFIKVFLTLSLSSIYFGCWAQDISGEWNGILRQEEGGVADSYFFTLNLIQDGNRIHGTSKVALSEDSEYFVTMKLKGKFKDDVFTFSESKIINQNTYEGLEWCFKTSSLTFTFQNGGFCLKGTWTGKAKSGQSCQPGTVKLCKIVPMASLESAKLNNEKEISSCSNITRSKF